MIENIIFLHSKGAEVKRKIIGTLFVQDIHQHIHSLSSLSFEFNISKVAVKKHLDYLHYMGYVEKINPNGKPVFLRLTDKGRQTAKKFINY